MLSMSLTIGSQHERTSTESNRNFFTVIATLRLPCKEAIYVELNASVMTGSGLKTVSKKKIK